MKFVTLALAIAATGAVAAIGVPILGRVQTHRVEAARRSQLASKLRIAKSAQIARDDPRWLAAARTFDKNKASAAAIYVGADRIEALQLFPDGAEKPRGEVAPAVPFFAKYIVADADFTSRLSAIVLDAKSYVLPGQSVTQCYIEPAVAFRVWKGAQFTDTVICFKCDQLAVLEYNDVAPKRTIGGHLSGRFHVAGDFITRSQLLALTKSAFPSDNAVQQLR